MSSRASKIFAISSLSLFHLVLIIVSLYVFVVKPAFGIAAFAKKPDDINTVPWDKVETLEKGDLLTADWGSGTKICFFISVDEERIQTCGFDSFFPDSWRRKDIKIFDVASRQEQEKYRDLLVQGVEQRFELEPLE